MNSDGAWNEMLDEFRALGGVAENIRLGHGVFGRGLFPIDPAKPIRIVVENGHVGLFGTVDSRMDKQIAALRANSVFGAFSVDNHLTVAGEDCVQ